MRYKTKLGKLYDSFEGDTLVSRICSKCGINKPIGEFNKNHRKREGFENNCNECLRSYTRKYKKDNKESVNAFNREYNRKNPEVKRESDRKWIERGDNRQKKNAADKEYRKSHPASREYNAINLARRRARLRNAVGKVSAREWRDILNFYDNTCLSCGRNDIKLTLDHIVPLISGGSNSVDNVQPLCGSCNSRKSRKTIDYRGDRIYGKQ